MVEAERASTREEAETWDCKDVNNLRFKPCVRDGREMYRKGGMAYP